MRRKSRRDQDAVTEAAEALGENPPSDRTSPRHKSEAPFPVVGIGASAGGLEALEQFLKHVPDSSGMAFVIVQHLDPTHKGIMPELLQRATTMKVAQVKERQKVEPNCVYVIPPNKDMTILHGVLHLMDPVKPRGLRLPIDSFFRSLAEDFQDHAVGVILSGMGSDGTLGLTTIKEKAGLAAVQDPASAGFDGMPRSAIEAGLADIVAPAEELPGKIIAYLRHVPPVATPESASDDKAGSGLEKVITLLRSHTGHDFFQYKKSTLYRRIERRMGVHQLGKIGDYVRYLQENSGELDLLFKELLIGVTSFFRDPEEWDRLRDTAIPTLLTDGRTGREIRAWVVGCSTGEEAYSLAIVFKEALEQVRPQGRFTLQVFATDLDRDAIDRARQGFYPANITADVSPERLSRFFTEEHGNYRVNKEIREMVIFAPQNVIKDPPFTKLDIVTCRNLLIYMEQDLQKVVLRLVHYSLKTDGILLLGSAETVGGFTKLFAQLDGKSRLYKRLKSDKPLEPVRFPRTFVPAPAGTQLPSEPPTSVVNMQSLADQLLLQTYSPAAVLVNNKGDVLYISGRTGKYLEPAAGKANWNIFVMAREGLRYELIGAFQKALRQKEMVNVRNLTFGINGGAQTVDLTVQIIEEPDALRGMVMIVFTDVAPLPETAATPTAKRASGGHSRLAQMQSELQNAQEEMQGVREEMQSSQEELRSTNEEMQSANEELQSTNEELMTSKEEMQSLNEELQTVNNESQAKVDELSRTSDDMNNLLNSTDIATVFLDGALRVRRFTPEATKTLRLIPGDVGRPITDITSDLLYPELHEDVQEVLRTLVFTERQVSTRDGRWFVVRIMPYRTTENRIDGVVITCMNITVSKVLETELRQLLDALPELVLTCLPNGSCDHLNHQWVEYTGISEAEQLGYKWLQQIHPDDRERIAAEWRATMDSGTNLDGEFRIRSKDGEYRRFRTRVAPVRKGNGEILKWYAANTEIEETKRAEDALRESKKRPARRSKTRGSPA